MEIIELGVYFVGLVVTIYNITTQLPNIVAQIKIRRHVPDSQFPSLICTLSISDYHSLPQDIKKSKVLFLTK